MIDKQYSPGAWTSSIQDSSVPQEMLAREHIMENGLRIITLSTPGYKTARAEVHVNAGSKDDPEGFEGTAHCLEHMMITGANIYPDEHARDDRLNQYGGQFNAGTSAIQTKFYTEESVVAEHLDNTIDMLLDIVQHPILRPEKIETERGVISGEMTQDQNNIDLRAIVHFMQTVFPGSPFAREIIGAHKSLAEIDEKVLRTFWNEHYLPHKTAITVQGPYSHEELLGMVKKHLTILGVNGKHDPEPVARWPEMQPNHAHMPIRGAKGINCNIGWNSFRKPRKTTQKESVILETLSVMVDKILNRELRDAGMVYGVDFQYYANGHPIMLSFSTDKNPRYVTEKVMDVLSHLCDSFEQQVDKLCKFMASDSLAPDQKQALCEAINGVLGLKDKEQITPETLADAKDKLVNLIPKAYPTAHDKLGAFINKVRDKLEEGNPLLTYKPDTTITQDGLDRYINEMKISDIKQSDHPLDVALLKMDHVLINRPVYPGDDPYARIYDTITLKEIHEMAARLFNQPCGSSYAGNKESLKLAPNGKEIAAMYKGPRINGPLVGWADPITELPYDPQSIANIAVNSAFSHRRL